MHSIKLIKVNRKSQILKPSVFGCLKDTPSINITKGCMHSCVYCYARGFTDAPPKGEVHLYKNLPEMLERELDRKRKLPRWVSFSTASDAFQDRDEILKTTYTVMKLLLERDIGISFLTKGFIPMELIELFTRYTHAVNAKIGIVSLSEDYRKRFEPFSASPFKRLLNIRNLNNINIGVSVRIDPIIPGITDSEDSLEHLMEKLNEAGVKNISVSSLVMRPSIMNFFQALPLKTAKAIIKNYHDQPRQRIITSAKTRLMPRDMRIAQYRYIKGLAQRYGIHCSVCGCKNPDLPWEFCSPWLDKKEAFNHNKQLALFSN